jgi:hypothetical protein
MYRRLVFYKYNIGIIHFNDFSLGRRYYQITNLKDLYHVSEEDDVYHRPIKWEMIKRPTDIEIAVRSLQSKNDTNNAEKIKAIFNRVVGIS